MDRLKFACYVGLMTSCGAVLGLFLPFLCFFLILGHTTLALFDMLRISPMLFTIVSVILCGGLGFWIGWSKGTTKYLDSRQTPLPNKWKRCPNPYL
jgi:hypothetical protein